MQSQISKFDGRRHGHCQRVKATPSFCTSGIHGSTQESLLSF